MTQPPHNPAQTQHNQDKTAVQAAIHELNEKLGGQRATAAALEISSETVISWGQGTTIPRGKYLKKLYIAYQNLSNNNPDIVQQLQTRTQPPQENILTIKDAVNALGGEYGTSRKTGIAVTTVEKWLDQGTIPHIASLETLAEAYQQEHGPNTDTAKKLHEMLNLAQRNPARSGRRAVRVNPDQRKRDITTIEAAITGLDGAIGTAQKTGIPDSTVSNWKKGRRNISLKNLEKLHTTYQKHRPTDPTAQELHDMLQRAQTNQAQRIQNTATAAGEDARSWQQTPQQPIAEPSTQPQAGSSRTQQQEQQPTAGPSQTRRQQPQQQFEQTQAWATDNSAAQETLIPTTPHPHPHQQQHLWPQTPQHDLTIDEELAWFERIAANQTPAPLTLTQDECAQLGLAEPPPPPGATGYDIIADWTMESGIDPQPQQLAEPPPPPRATGNIITGWIMESGIDPQPHDPETLAHIRQRKSEAEARRRKDPKKKERILKQKRESEARRLDRQRAEAAQLQDPRPSGQYVPQQQEPDWRRSQGVNAQEQLADAEPPELQPLPQPDQTLGGEQQLAARRHATFLEAQQRETARRVTELERDIGYYR